MANFNKVILAGNLTRDPEVRYTPKGTAIVRLGLAINRNWTTETGERKEEVTFVDVDAFGKTAETIGKYFKKGRPILMEGRLRYETWEDKQTNQKRSKLGVVLETFQFLDSQRGGEMGSGPSSSTRSATAASSSSLAEAPEPEMPPQEADDVPF